MITDVTRIGDWSPETERAESEWIDGATTAVVGARFRGHNRWGRGKGSTTCKVTMADPSRSFAFEVGRPRKPETHWTYLFNPNKDTTVVTGVVSSC